MNKETALSKFVKNNFTFLTSPDFDTKRLKRISRDYFFKQHNKKFGIPIIQEVRIALIKYLRKNGIRQSRIEYYIQKLPVFSNLGNKNKEVLLGYMTDDKYDSGIAPEDVHILQNINAFQAAKEHVSKDIDNQYKEKIGTYNKMIEQKQDDYNSLPSIIDVGPIPEPEYNPDIEAETLWWERLYLKDNPFPRKDGLSDIDKDLYESVIVKTAPFIKVLNATRDDATYILKTAFLLVGDFGYGKTTFMDYLSYHLVHKKILPLRITCGRPFPDSSGFSHNFYLSLLKSLKDEVRYESSASYTTFVDLDIEDHIFTLCEAVLNKHSGIIVFLDDYHKHQSSYEAIYEFLGSLQILKDKLVRKNLEVGFMVSGVREWKNELLRNSQMSGFFDSGTIEMGEISAKSVCDVFNQRIKAYCYDSYPRQIQLRFVKSIFEKAKGKAGYRDYLNFIISELENNNYAVVNTPVDVSPDELDRIKKYIEKNNALSSALNKLIYESKFKKFTSEQVGKCLEILVQTSLHGGFTEEDELFRDNKHYFQRLKESQFLQKQRMSKKEFKWVVKSEFQRTFDEIDRNFNKSLSDYILKLYGGKNYHKLARQQQDTEPGKLKEEKRFFATVENKMERSSRSNLRMALQMFDSINFSDIGKGGSERSQNAIQAMEHISLALFGTDGMLRLFNEAKISASEMRWQLHWLGTESVTEYYKCENNYNREPEQLNYERLIRQVNDTFPIVAACLKTVLQDICKPDAGSVGCFGCPVHHTNSERILFSEVRDSYYAADRASHFRYVEKATNYLEERFRLFLYVTTTLLFGEDNLINLMPPATKNYAIKNRDRRTNYASFFNPFNGLTRPQFRELFLNTGKIKKFIVGELDLRWQTRDWETFFNVFIDENIATSHKQVNSYSHSERDKYLQYCRMARQLIAQVNVAIRRIISKNAFILLIDRTNPNSVEDAIFKYSFKIDKSKKALPSNEKVIVLDSEVLYRQEDLYEHSISPDIYNKVIANIHGKLRNTGYYLEDLMNVDYITANYNVPYCQFLSTLSYAIHIDKTIEVYPWYGSTILIKKV